MYDIYDSWQLFPFSDLIIFDCPICRTRVQVLGPNFVDNLPSNLYIDSLLQLVGIQNIVSESRNSGTPPTTPIITSPPQNTDMFAAGSRCVHCKSMCDNAEITQCDHCKLVNKYKSLLACYVTLLLCLIWFPYKCIFFFRNSAKFVGYNIWMICGSN